MNTWKNATTADLLHKARCADPTLAIRRELERRGLAYCEQRREWFKDSMTAWAIAACAE